MTDRAPLLECRELDVEINGVGVVRQLNLSIHAGQCWCVLGPNGSGKTTLLHTLAGLRQPRAGQVRLQGDLLSQLGRRDIAMRLGILFQHQQDSFPASVQETVLQGRHPYLRPWQWENDVDKSVTQAALQTLELEALAHRNIQSLSGGERQRAAIATLLAQQTPLCLLDEPSNHLDLRHRIRLLGEVLTRGQGSGQGFCMSLHDVNLASRFATHALLLFGDGEFSLGELQKTLDQRALERLYGLPMQALQTDNGTVWIPV